MLIALYVLALTAFVMFLLIRLSAARDEIQRLRDRDDSDERRVTAEYEAYKQGIAISIACLMAGLAAAAWYTPNRSGARRDY